MKREVGIGRHLRQKKKWGIAPEVTMAFIKHESSYQQGAKPERTRIFFWTDTRKKKSTAYGYAQVTDGTWESYKKATDIGLFLEETSVMLSILLAGITTEAAKN